MPIRNVVFILFLAVLVAVPSTAAAQSAKARYEQAKARERELTKAQRPPPLSQLRDTVRSFEQIPRRYPRSGYADDALYWGGLLAFEAYRQYEDEADREAGVKMLEWLMREYPYSPRRNDAQARLDKERVDLPPDQTSLATLQRILRTNLPGSVRITIELDREIPFTHDTLSGPDRFFVDLQGVKSDPHLRGALRSDEADDVLREVRVGTQSPTVTRVVLEFSEQARHQVSTLTDPYRVVIDVPRRTAPVPEPFPTAGRRTEEPTGAGSTPVDLATSPVEAPLDPTSGSPRAAPEMGPEKAPEMAAAGAVGAPAGSPPPVDPGGPGDPVPATFPEAATEDEAADAPGTASIESARNETAERLASVEPSAVPPPGVPDLPTRDAPEAADAADFSEPRAPETNAEGGFSLGRQLGLGIGRVVIDPGHGGHDPGTRGNGVVEKELVLDVALRLEQLLKAEGIDVVLTRRTDVFIERTERTAIANRHQADLFLSIHANAARNGQARGIETYFLNFASDKNAEEVAARENATSGHTMHNLPDIVQAILRNNKVDESRDLAEMVQDAMIKGLRSTSPDLPDRGVKSAPFTVLIGAEMPSVLAEISFVTNREEGGLLKTSAYRQQIAEALRGAVLRYQRSLKPDGTVAEQ